MNQKEKLQETTIKALQGRLEENNNKPNFKEMFDELWSFDDGEWYIDFYNEYYPKDKEEFIDMLVQDELNNQGYLSAQENWDLNRADTRKLYGMIYDRIIKENK